MDGVGWAGTAMILAPVLGTLLVVALLTALGVRSERWKRRKH